VLRTSAQQIIELQGAGGEPFTIFVDRVLHAFGAVFGIPASEIVTSVRVNIADGGVDTEVRRGASGDPTGLLGEQTIWQYKGTDYANIDWAALLKGAYAETCIRAGYAFRLAVADDMPAATITTREADLLTEARKLNPESPAPRIVTASRLASLANYFPALVLETFYPSLQQDLLHLGAWRNAAEDRTRSFVQISDWATVQDELGAHVDFGQTPPTAVRTVQGEAGVGKTRLVYETVRRIPGAEGLVVYTQGESALNVARTALNNASARLVLVADECDVHVRHQLGQILNGDRTRIRVIAIDNTLQRLNGPDPELFLGKMTSASLEAVLETNFSEVDVARRRAYAELAEGFPRLAAELCFNDSRISANGDVRSVIPVFSDFYRVRLTDGEREALSALGLITKLGFSGEAAPQLKIWCEFLDLDSRNLRRTLDQIHDGPGFVARTPRYFRVVPELIAKIAFDEGWRRWASSDPSGFLNGIPEDLLDEFLKRVRESGSEEVRHICADHFRTWADTLVPADLTEALVVRRLERLADTYPVEYLPLVRRLVESASQEQLLAVTGRGDHTGGWGPRRTLVWLAERFAQFPEYWSDSERILAALSSAESEPDIANNATAIWGQGFRVFLSGTATPFDARLLRLRERLLDPRDEVRAVARKVMGAPLSQQAMRMVGPSVIAGRIPPAEWRPATNHAAAACVATTLELYAEATRWNSETRDAVVDELLSAFRFLVSTGYLDQLRDILQDVTLSDDERVTLIETLDTVIEYDLKSSGPESVEIHEPHSRPSPESPREASSNVVVNLEAARIADAITSWRQSLVASDVHSRLLSLVGRQRWSTFRMRNEQQWQRELDQLAVEVVRDVSLLGSELLWLTSGTAHAAGEFGSAIGRADSAAECFELVMGTAQTGVGGIFARGYADGLARSHPTQLRVVIDWITAQEKALPEVAVEVAISVGEPAEPLVRALRLYDAGRLPARFLYARNFSTSGGAISASDLTALLERLAPAAAAGDGTALRVSLENLASFVPYKVSDTPDRELSAHPTIRALAWRILAAVPDGDVPPSHWWASLVGHLGHFEPAKAARYLARLLGAGSSLRADGLEGALLLLATREPADVMEALGDVMLDDTLGRRFFFADYKAVFAALPDEIKLAWLDRVGVEGARKMARHVGAPYVSAGNEPVLPTFTEDFLRRYGDDDRTCREFMAGTRGLRVYSGDIAAQHEEEAAVARLFLDHPIKSIREWALSEEQSARTLAAAERVREAEQDLP
jgi:hypothetical protein